MDESRKTETTRLITVGRLPGKSGWFVWGDERFDDGTGATHDGYGPFLTYAAARPEVTRFARHLGWRTGSYVVVDGRQAA